jgi:hypothetical protein
LLAAALAAQQPPAAQKAAPKAPKEEQPAPAQQQPPQPPPPPAPPRDRRQSGYLYDGTGRLVPGAVGAREQRRDGVVERQQTIQDVNGRPVTIRAEQERVIESRGADQVSERVIQRFDPGGRSTGKQVIRIETRRAPDGSLITTENIYESDLNGRLQFTERRTTTESKAPSGTTSSVVVEQPGFQGALRVVERTDRVETKKSESVTEAVSTVRQIDPNGRLEERRRESTVTSKVGNVTSQQSQQWEFQPTGKVELVGRRVSNLTERPDGSQVEDTEVYTTRIAGTTPDLNRPGVPTLEQKVRREKTVQPDGRIVESTRAQIRTVAEPSRLGGLVVTEQVTVPNPGGQTIQTTVSERDANGRIVPVQRTVEEQKK